MSADISLLPEDERKKEAERKKTPPPVQKPGELRMHVPESDEENIEVIEVDEGDVSQVLAGEPFVTRIIFQTQALVAGMWQKLFHPPELEPPPKLPPQFFKPPTGGKPGAPAVPGAKTDAGGKPKVSIKPDEEAARRVRVIKRVRKPVRVSFLEDEELQLQIDIPRRRFTILLTTIVFILLFGGGYGVLQWQGDRARANLADVKQQIADVEARSKERNATWATYSDLEPRLRAVSDLLASHVNPTKVFYFLEQYTDPDVSYGSFTLTPDGRLTLAASAKSYEATARQIVALRESGFVTDVTSVGFQIVNATKEEGERKVFETKSVGFQIGMALVPTVLKAGGSTELTTD
ncbi:hypothetical protein L0Y59_05035 [Candidatus Uhrbacteria bacterium]|nr:hypothetical protein [Candidatus Uhrbacteria bacterium]